MPEIVKGLTPIKGESFLDSVLSKETFETLDKHAHTLDQVSGLIDKTSKLLGNPLLSQVIEMVSQSKTAQAAIPTDPWDAPTMSQMVSGTPQAPVQPRAAPIQPVTVQAPSVTQEPPRAVQEPSNVTSNEGSELHQQVKGEIDKLSEKDLMDFLMKMSNNPEVVEMMKKDEDVKDDKDVKDVKEVNKDEIMEK